MLLSNGGQVLSLEILGQANDSGPQAAMYISNFTSDQAAHQNLLTVPYLTGCSKNLLGISMGPPTAADRRSSDGVGQVGHGPFRTFQDDAASADKFKRIHAHESSPKSNISMGF